MDTRGSVASPRVGVDLGDLVGQPGIADGTGTGFAAAAGVEGGTGDLQQFTRPFDAVARLLLRLDERVHRHRVSIAKKPSHA
jgi:hypothetical protein